MKRLKNLAFAVVLGTVLISALTVTAGAVVTESSGNGKALYNGVMLPKLPDYDTLAYPVAFIDEFDMSDFGGFGKMFQLSCIDSSVYWADGLVPSSSGSRIQSYYFTVKEDADILGFPFVDTWSSFVSDSFDSGSIISLAPLWTNTDILDEDGTTYLSSSSPIPLDGMNVITWDGDTTGLESYGDNHIRVGDYVDFSSGIAVLDSGNQLLVTTDFYSEDSFSGLLVNGSVAAVISSPDVGLVFYYSSNGSVTYRTTLFAYPASSELPPDEGGSDIDFSRTSLTINDFDIYDDSAEYAVSWAYLPDIPYPNNIQYYLRGSLSDYSFGVFDVYLGSSDDPPQALGPVWYDFTDLTPGTEYTFTAELLYTYGYSVNPTYLSSGVTVSDTFTTASTSDVSDGDKAIINAIDNANRDNQQWLDSNYGEAVGDLPEDTASTDAMIGDLDLKEEAYKNDAFDRFQELSSAFTGFDGDVASGIGLAGTLFSRFFNVLGSYKIIYTFPLLLGLALVIIGRLGRSGGPRSGRDGDVPGQFKMDGW